MADYFWSRCPGRFVDKTTGVAWKGATFTGSVREWYETLIEVIVDVEQRAADKEKAAIHGASWTADPNVFVIVEASVLYKPVYDESADRIEPMIGVIGYDRHGYIRNIPISSSNDLRGTGKLMLSRSIEGLGDELIGSVKVLDMPEYRS
jgi:hypothetical protein